MKIAVLGAGMVGRCIAKDLAADYDVTSFDINPQNLQALQQAGVAIRQADLQQYELYPTMFESYPLLVSAVPGFMGYRVLEAIIAAGKNVVDISFFPEDALQLQEAAKQKGVTAIVDCGVAPGMSNWILGRYNACMHITHFECMVGGLPLLRIKPFEYKAPFSPIDVLEEYTRPARYIENGHMVIKPALSEPELIHFDKAGTLEAFNTDGLRSILFTMKHIPNLKEKTLRYPGHIALIQSLQQAGFFDKETIDVNGQAISPLDFTSKILFRSWKLEPTDEEFTLMTVKINGTQNGQTKCVEYFLYDSFDAETQTASMSRSTGYTCNAAVNLIAKGLFTDKGVFPPELIGHREDCFAFVLNYLQERKVIWHKKETTV